MRNILVTGAAGFILSNYVNYMSKKYPEMKFIVLDVLDYCASLENIDKNANVEIVIGNIKNKELVTYILNKFEIDTVVHGAAMTHVDISFYNSVKFTKNNVYATHILLETVRIYHEKTNKIEKFIYISTDEVYGENLGEDAHSETSIMLPTNVYAATKGSSELLAFAYYKSFKIPIMISRCNNCIGIHQYPDKLLPKFICQLLNGQKLTIHGKGESRRNFIEVWDTCAAFELILFKGVIGQTYNISSDENNEYTVMEVAKIIIKLMYPTIDTENEEELNQYIEYVPDRLFNDSRYLISSEKLHELGWAPKKTDFVENVRELIEWYKVHKSRYGF